METGSNIYNKIQNAKIQSKYLSNGKGNMLINHHGKTNLHFINSIYLTLLKFNYIVLENGVISES